MAPGDDRTHIGERLRTLQHCALHRRTIRLVCRSCGHLRYLEAIRLWWLFSRRMWDDRLPQAIERLCCAKCRAAGRTERFRFEITRERPDEQPQPPYPDEREWKRIVSRYRS
jgi:hypothetical protein